MLRPGPYELRRAVCLLAAAFVVPAALGLAALRSAPEPRPFPAAGSVLAAPAKAGVPQASPFGQETENRPSPANATKNATEGSNKEGGG